MELRGKIFYAAAILCLVSGTGACRKEINRTEGIVQEGQGGTGENPENPETAASWTKISPADIVNVNCLEVFNSELYAGGNFSTANVKFFGKLSGGQLLPVLPGNVVGTGVNDLQVHNNKLYVAGDYSQHSIDVFNLMSYDGTVFTAINVGISLFDEVHCIYQYGNDLLIGGDFDPGGQNTCITANVERLVNDVPVGFGGYTTVIRSIEAYGAFVYGADANGKFVRYNAGGWAVNTFPTYTSNDKVQDLCVVNDSFYILGTFNNNTSVKKLSPAWVITHEPVKALGTLSTLSGIKSINGEVYVFGSGLMCNGVYKSNVLHKKADGTWEAVGDLKAKVSDLVFFNGKFVAATNTGIYEF